MHHLGVHHERRDFGIFAQVVEHSVGNISDARLQGQELFGDTTTAIFAQEESDDVGTDLLRDLVGGCKSLYAIVGIGAHDADHLIGVDFEDRRTDTVVGSVDGDFAAVRGIGGEVNIVHAVKSLRQRFVKLDEYLVGKGSVGGDVSDTCTEDDFAVGGDIGGFDDGPIHFSVETVASFLRHFREVTVVVMAIVGVDALTKVGHVLVRCAEIERIGTRERTVDMVGGRSARKEVDFERTAFSMLTLSLSGNRLGDEFRSTGGSKTR